MVFTVSMRIGEGGASRRTVLRVAAGTALSAAAALGLDGCGLGSSGPDWISGPDPLSALHRATRQLAGRYDAAILAQPSLAARLEPLRDNHRAHAAALARELAITDDASTGQPSPDALESALSRSADTLAVLVAAEEAAVTEATVAYLAAPDWRLPLLGSIVACRASHIEALA
jgi:hypothetical protein